MPRKKSRKIRAQEMTDLLVRYGDYGPKDDEELAEVIEDAIEEDFPLAEHLCFHALAEHTLESVHKTSWLKRKVKYGDSHGQLIKKLLDSGAKAKDLAMFARLSQKQYLCNLACIFDSAWGWGPELPYSQFRVFSVDEDDNPISMLEDLHESIDTSDLKYEMKRSRQAELEREEYYDSMDG